MKKRNVTLSLDRNVYSKYKFYCQQNAIALSRSIEIFMEEQTKNFEEEKKSL
jgi:hypothetical protein